MWKSLSAVFLGVLISLAVGLLTVFGIVAPVFQTFLPEGLARASALPAVILVFAVAFSLYFGGMAAGYRAPSRRRLHGVIVAVALFGISPVLNLAAHKDPFPQLRTPGTALLAAVLLVVSVGAAYVGASRGKSLYAYNRSLVRRRSSSGKRGSAPSEPGGQGSDGPESPRGR